MGFVLKVYECKCNEEYEDLVERDGDLTCPCPKCGTINSPCFAAPNVAAFSIMDRDAQISHLKKRADDHNRTHIHGNK